MVALYRRKFLLTGGAALAGAALSGPARAARRTGPGGFSKDGLAKIPQALQPDAIFEPLGMKDTGFWFPKEKQARVATMYKMDPETGARSAVPWSFPDEPPHYASGGTGLLSTADDYLKFARMLLGRGRSGDVRILSHPSVAKMTTNWLTPEQRKIPGVAGPDFWAGQGFGLGVSVVDDVTKLGMLPYASKGSFSWNGAFGTWWVADPVEDMIAIYLAQNWMDLAPNPNPDKRPAPSMARLFAPPVIFSSLAYQAIDD